MAINWGKASKVNKNLNIEVMIWTRFGYPIFHHHMGNHCVVVIFAIFGLCLESEKLYNLDQSGDG